MGRILILAVVLVNVLTTPSPFDWMAKSLEIIGDLTLKELTLPGTHDSGAYYLSNNLMPGDQSDSVEAAILVAEKLGVPVEDVITPWGLAQDLDVYSQLERGIRYVDFRCGWDKGDWYTFHFEVGSTCRTMLLDVSRFIAESPKEVLILEISHEEGNPDDADVEALEELIIMILGPKLYKVDYSFESTINDITNSERTVLVTLEKQTGKYSDLLWNSAIIYNTYANSDNLTKMMNFNQNQIKDYLSGVQSDKLFKISWTLTPAANVIVKSLLPLNPKNLIELADTANKHLASFYKDRRAEGMVPWGNIVIIDHFESSPILDIVLNMNGIPSSFDL